MVFQSFFMLATEEGFFVRVVETFKYKVEIFRCDCGNISFRLLNLQRKVMTDFCEKPR
ncbi:MAG: hypothetical protein H6Q76_2163 [Firmicutes bacterium]|nr:hypothetical protein [Bacillota bacterium]